MDVPTNLVALCLTADIGGVKLRALLARFGNVENVLAASEAELQAVPGIGPRTAAAIQAVDVENTAAEMAQWQNDGIGILTWEHPDYPARLRPLRDAPPVLFGRGDLSPADTRAVAIVGTRDPAAESEQLALALGFELAGRGWTVVSGLAWGVDFAAHDGAARAGRTIAVLGGGLHAPLPSKKRELTVRILARGALLSEVHPHATPNTRALVARNRLIAGLSRAVIVVEAGEDSGSLHAARQARNQGRALFAVQNGRAGNKSLLEENAAHPLAADFADWDALDEVLSALP